MNRRLKCIVKSIIKNLALYQHYKMYTLFFLRSIGFGLALFLFLSSCSNPTTRTIKSPISDPDRLTQTLENPSQTGPLRFHEHIKVRSKKQTTSFLQQAFVSDYEAIRSVYSHNLLRRFEVALYREALLRMMKTEFYLTLLSGQKTFHRILSEVQHSRFYHGIRQYHNHLQQSLNESSLATRQVIMATIIATARQLSLIEEKQKNVEEAITEVESINSFEDPEDIQNNLISILITSSLDASEDNNNPHLKIDTPEDLRKALLEIKDSWMIFKSQLLKDQPGAMILFEDVEDQNGNHLLLKDFIVARYNHYLYPKNEDIYLPNHFLDDISQDIGNIEAIKDDIYDDIQPLIEHISNKVLKRVPYLVHRYRSNRQSLLNHDFVVDQVKKDLERVDPEVLEAYQGLVQRKEESITPSMANIAMATSTVAVCWVGRPVAISATVASSLTGFLDQASFKEALFKGVMFGLNSFSQYEVIHSSNPFNIISSIIFVALCSNQGKSRLSSSLIGRTSLEHAGSIRSRLEIILDPKRLKKLLWEKMTDINAGPAALASVTILAGVQAHRQGIDSLWNNPEFHFSFFFTAIVEFVMIFKSIQSGKAFFSNAHLKAMQGLTKTLFGTSLSTQFFFSLTEHGNLKEIDWNRAFFEAGLFGPFVSLTTTKLVINFMVDPFSGFLAHARSRYLFQNGKGHRELATFLLMLGKNTLGNSLYLYSINNLFDKGDKENVH